MADKFEFLRKRHVQGQEQFEDMAMSSSGVNTENNGCKKQECTMTESAVASSENSLRKSAMFTSSSVTSSEMEEKTAAMASASFHGRSSSEYRQRNDRKVTSEVV